MSLHRLTQSLRHLFSRASRRKQTNARRQTSARLELLALESRETPATLTTGTVSGLAFVDSNNNGRRDGAEPALAGASFTLVGNTDFGRAVRATVATGAAGGFRFLNVATGSYQVIAEPVAGFTPLGANHPVVVFFGRVNGGKTVGVPVRYAGLPAGNVSINQFLNTTTVSAFQTQPPGAGRTRVNPRENSAPEVIAAQDITAGKNAVDRLINLRSVFTDPDFNSRVRIDTNFGSIFLDLFDNQSPGHVNNFINYITSNRYDSSIFHRLGGFLHGDPNTRDVLQGGQFRFNRANNNSTLTQIQTFSAIRDAVLIPNVAGTIAMAKLNSANSATSQFFFNLIDNTDALSPQQQGNGGFTVFGKIDPASQPVLNALAALNVQDKSSFNSSLSDLPLRDSATGAFPGTTAASDYAFVTDVVVVRRARANVEAMTYKVIGNTNSTLVRSLLNKNNLTLDYAPNATGTSRITIRATDRFGAFVDTSFNVTVANNAPVASVVLTPATVGTNSTLTATATGNDINGGDLTFTYTWKKNGTVIKTTAGTESKTDTLDLSLANNGDKSDVITVEVTANDGFLNSAVASASKTVQDTAAAISNLAFTPDAPGTDDLLKVTTIATDIDGDAITFTYRWLVDDVVVPNATTDTLDLSQAGHGNVGQTVKVEVTPTSGGINGTMVSFSKVIL